jgi:hypothetical protein
MKLPLITRGSGTLFFELIGRKNCYLTKKELQMVPGL